MKILIFDENNEKHHIQPFAVDIPVTWANAEETELLRLAESMTSWLRSDSMSTLKEFIDDSLRQMLEERQNEAPKKRTVLNKHFNFESTSQKIFTQAPGTLIHVHACLTKEDWYDGIIDYIEYNQLSFGTPETGGFQYLEALLHLWKGIKPDKKLDQVKQFITNKLASPKQTEVIRLPQLTEMFKYWWSSIPFDLEYLKPLQDNHDELMTLLFVAGPNADAKVNRYSGVVKTTVFSIAQMNEALCRLTDGVIKELNLLTLHDNKQLTEIDKYKVGLDLAKRRAKLRIGYSKYSNAEAAEYQIMWQSWLADEKKFFNQIKSLSYSERPEDSITFTITPDQLEELRQELGRFVDNSARLRTLLDGRPVDGKVVILDSCSQRKFCEIFKRLKYNGVIPQSSSEIKTWLKTHFRRTTKPLNNLSVEDLFQISNKPVSDRIREFEWLTYKSRDQLEKEERGS